MAWSRWFGENRRPASRRVSRRFRPHLECLESRLNPSSYDSLAFAELLPIDPNIPAHVSQLLDPGHVKLFRFTVEDDGLFSATVAASSPHDLDPSVALLDERGVLLIQSDDRAFSDTTAEISQHLRPGVFYLSVSAESASAAGSNLQFELTASHQLASPPFTPLPDNVSQVRDWDNDGIVDFFGGNFLYRGLGDGTFQKTTFSFAAHNYSLFAAGDFNRDTLVDFACGDQIYLNNGGGTFRRSQELFGYVNQQNLSVRPVAGLFDHDEFLDLAVNDHLRGTILLYRGDGQGNFRPPITSDTAIPLYFSDGTMVGADFNGDGFLDLQLPSRSSFTVPISGVAFVPGKGDGTFGTSILQSIFTPGSTTIDLSVIDLGKDGVPDLALFTNTGQIFLVGNDGDGQFSNVATLGSAGSGINSIVVVDVNDDGFDDVLGPSGDGVVFVFLAESENTFRPPIVQQSFGSGRPSAGDFDRDGFADVALGNLILLSNGNGTFQDSSVLRPGNPPDFVRTGDFNNDGRPDMISAGGSHNVAILLGDGAGNFAVSTLVLEGFVGGLEIEDINGDGRDDLVVSHFLVTSNGSREYYLLAYLGLGDGTFRLSEDMPADGGTFVVGRFDDDDHIDARFGSHLFYGAGDGTFSDGPLHSELNGNRLVGSSDFNGDGIVDLLTTPFHSHFGSSLNVLLGNSNGSYTSSDSIPVFEEFGMFFGFYSAVLIDDFRSSDRVASQVEDLVVVEFGTASVYFGDGDGHFTKVNEFIAEVGSPATGDFNGDNITDIAIADRDGRAIHVYLGQGGGQFVKVFDLLLDNPPTGLTVDDFNQDGRADLTIANGGVLSIAFGLGDGTFETAASGRGIAAQHRPVLFDLDGDGVATDTAILNKEGEILFRRAAANQRDDFAPPGIVNRVVDESVTPVRVFVTSARDFVVIESSNGPIFAAINRAPDAIKFDSINLYAWSRSAEAFLLPTTISTGRLPTRIIAGDLDNDGLEDLIVGNSLDATISIVMQSSPGVFGTPITRSVGINPSSIAIADGTSEFGPDIIVAGQDSGDVTVLENDREHSFLNQSRYRGGIGLYDTKAIPGGATLVSQQQPSGVAAADFTGDGVTDLITVTRGSDQLNILVGKASGGYVDVRKVSFVPALARGQPPVGFEPSQIVAGDFDHDGHIDAAILMEDSSEIWIYLNDGDGNFAHPIRTFAGASAKGFSFVDRSSTQQQDQILVGNDFGDILTLVGDGTGHFDFDRTNLNKRPLAVIDLNGDGVKDVVLANQSLDQISTYLRKPGENQFDTASAVEPSDQPLLAPGAVQLAYLNDDLYADLIVANRLSNNVLVFAGQSDGSFAPPRSYDVGFDPSDLTVADLDGDGDLDVIVPNRGSNDVSILLGEVNGNVWSATAGPRLHSGGAAPIDVAVKDQTGDGIPDLIVTNSDGKIATLAGIGSNNVGTGFFNDVNPPTISLPNSVAQPSGLFGNVFVDSSGNLLGIDPLTLAPTTLFNERSVATFGFDGLANSFDVDFASTRIVAAFDDGTIGVLEYGADNLYHVTAEFSGFDDAISALAVLEQSEGYEVYVALDGRDVLVVLTGSDFVQIATTSTDSIDQTPSAGEAVITVLQDAEVALITTLLLAAAGTRTQDLYDSGVSDDLLSLFISSPLLSDSAVDAVLAELESTAFVKSTLENNEGPSEEFTPDKPEAEAPPEEQAPAWERFPLGLEELLQELLNRLRRTQAGRQNTKISVEPDGMREEETFVVCLGDAESDGEAFAALTRFDRSVIDELPSGTPAFSWESLMLPMLVATTVLHTSRPETSRSRPNRRPSAGRMTSWRRTSNTGSGQMLLRDRWVVPSLLLAFGNRAIDLLTSFLRGMDLKTDRFIESFVDHPLTTASDEPKASDLSQAHDGVELDKTSSNEAILVFDSS